MRLLTITEAAERLRISKRTLYAHCRSGVVECVRIGKFWRIPADALKPKRMGSPKEPRRHRLISQADVDSFIENYSVHRHIDEGLERRRNKQKAETAI